jgi:hypothetical protein
MSLLLTQLMIRTFKNKKKEKSYNLRIVRHNTHTKTNVSVPRASRAKAFSQAVAKMPHVRVHANLLSSGILVLPEGDRQTEDLHFLPRGLLNTTGGRPHKISHTIALAITSTPEQALVATLWAV